MGCLRAPLRGSGLELREAIPEAHKVALADLAEGDAIVRYGVTIGYANRAIARGSWVHEGLMTAPAAPPLADCPLATAMPETLAALEGYTFEGYRNPDGSVGTKNILGISTTVQCVAPTVEHAVRRIKAEILPLFPHVDDVVAITHPYGCGVAIDAPGAAIPIRTLRNLALHPNFGGRSDGGEPGLRKAAAGAPDGVRTHCRCSRRALRCGAAGCDSTASARLWPRSWRWPRRSLKKLNRRRRVTCPAADLVVGLQCGGSDAISGVTANPAVGFAADLLVRAGATVMFSEVTEVRDAAHLLTARAATPEIAQDFVREMAWYDEYLQRRSGRAANPTPGNKQGGSGQRRGEGDGVDCQGGQTALRA